MNREDIIRMVWKAGFERLGHTNNEWVCYPEDIERFAALVASVEREEILAFASSEAFNRQYGEKSPFAYELANAIRAKGQA